MSVLVAAALAGASVAALVALPPVSAVRLQGVAVRRTDRGRSEDTGSVAPAGLAAPRSGTASRRPAPGRRPLATVAVAAVVAVGFAFGPVLALLCAAGAAAAVRWWTRRAIEQASSAERDGAVEACGALAAELRAGRAPAEALEAAGAVAAGPFRLSLQAAASAARLGGDVPAALLAAGPGRASAVTPVLRALAACWAVCSGTGAGLAAAVERLEEGLRAERRQRQALDAELASPRATAGLLAVLPAAGLLMAAGLGADPVHVLLQTPLGLVCLALGLGLDVLGVLWTQRLVTGAVRSV